MKRKITSRDIRFFFFGVLFMLAVTLLYEWKDFKAGFSGAFRNNTEISR